MLTPRSSDQPPSADIQRLVDVIKYYEITTRTLMQALGTRMVDGEREHVDSSEYNVGVDVIVVGKRDGRIYVEPFDPTIRGT